MQNVGMALVCIDFIAFMGLGACIAFMAFMAFMHLGACILALMDFMAGITDCLVSATKMTERNSSCGSNAKCKT